VRRTALEAPEGTEIASHVGARRECHVLGAVEPEHQGEPGEHLIDARSAEAAQAGLRPSGSEPSPENSTQKTSPSRSPRLLRLEEPSPSICLRSLLLGDCGIREEGVELPRDTGWKFREHRALAGPVSVVVAEIA